MARDIFDEFLISVCVLWISASLKFTSVRVEEKIALNRNGCISVNWIRIKRRNSWEEIAEARPKKSGTFCLGYLRTARNKQCLKWVTFRGNDIHSVKHFTNKAQTVYWRWFSFLIKATIKKVNTIQLAGAQLIITLQRLSNFSLQFDIRISRFVRVTKEKTRSPCW